MRARWLPQGAPGRTSGSSLTLLRLDAAAAGLEPISEIRTDALLPQETTFDASGRRLVTTAFQFDDPRRAGGALQVRALGDGERPTLRRLPEELEMPHGAHFVQILR